MFRLFDRLAREVFCKLLLDITDQGLGKPETKPDCGAAYLNAEIGCDKMYNNVPSEREKFSRASVRTRVRPNLRWHCSNELCGQLLL
jgi:hypothetical protein